MQEYLREIAHEYAEGARRVAGALKAPFIRLRRRFWFQGAQEAREVPDAGYFVAPDGSVRKKYPAAHVTKKLRRVFRTPDKIRKYIDDSQAALSFAKAEIERKDAALKDIKSTIMAGKGAFPVLMEKLKEAIG
jgi:hypothetical protein